MDAGGGVGRAARAAPARGRRTFVDRLGLAQSAVSKHLAVLRAVDLVLVRVDGKHRCYRVNGRR